MTILPLVILAVVLYPGLPVLCFAIITWRLSRIEKRIAGLYRRVQ